MTVEEYVVSYGFSWTINIPFSPNSFLGESQVVNPINYRKDMTTTMITTQITTTTTTTTTTKPLLKLHDWLHEFFFSHPVVLTAVFLIACIIHLCGNF